MIDFPAFQALVKRYPCATAASLMRRLDRIQTNKQTEFDIRLAVMAMQIGKIVEDDVMRELVRADVEAQFEV